MNFINVPSEKWKMFGEQLWLKKLAGYTTPELRTNVKDKKVDTEKELAYARQTKPLILLKTYYESYSLRYFMSSRAYSA